MGKMITIVTFLLSPPQQNPKKVIKIVVNYTKKYLGIKKFYQLLGRRGWGKLKGLTLFTIISHQ